MKKLLLGIFGLALLFILLVVFVQTQLQPVSNDSKSQDFLITKGSSVASIAANLKKANLIRSAVAFKFYVQLTNAQSKIPAGEFGLSPNLSVPELVRTLQKGPKEIWVTVPEGLRREEVAIKFASSLGKDETFIQEFLNLSENKEGRLFPDTYLFPKTASAQAIVSKMLSTFEKKFGAEITEEELIIASLLERETRADSEKPVVAGILYKRLQANWPLQVDATLQYAKDSLNCKTVNKDCVFWKPIYAEDKNLNSGFNTYKFTGLPPQPISSAGLTSLKASQNPEESEYWFYLHDEEGKIHYARTIEEHNSNINKYLN